MTFGKRKACGFAIVALMAGPGVAELSAKWQSGRHNPVKSTKAFNSLPVEEQMRIAGVTIPSPPYKFGRISASDFPAPKNERQAIAVLNYLASGKEPRLDKVFAGYSPSSKCLGEDARSCGLLLMSKVNAKSSDFARSFLELQEIDVNGKRVKNVGSILVTVEMSGSARLGRLTVLLHLTETNVVRSVAITLPRDPASANTEAEYAATAIYEAALISIGSSCVDMSNELKFYQFFQNSVKPSIKRQGRSTYVGVADASDSYSSRSDKIALCNVLMRYDSETGSATWAVDERNPLGKFHTARVTFTSN